jgi:hypothetical protein
MRPPSAVETRIHSWFALACRRALIHAREPVSFRCSRNNGVDRSEIIALSKQRGVQRRVSRFADADRLICRGDPRMRVIPLDRTGETRGDFSE